MALDHSLNLSDEGKPLVGVEVMSSEGFSWRQGAHEGESIPFQNINKTNRQESACDREHTYVVGGQALIYSISTPPFFPFAVMKPIRGGR
jgi:hypothetical protein